MVTYEEVEGETPNGGVKHCAYFMDAEGEPTTKADAQAIEIIEYDEEDNVVGRTYLTKGKHTSPVMSIDDHGREHRGPGEGGGQYVRQGSGSSGTKKKKKKPTTESGAESTEAPTPALTDVPTVPVPRGELEVITNEQGLKVVKARSGKVPEGVIKVYDPEKPVDLRVVNEEKAPPEVHKEILEKAKAKIAAVPQPTPEEKAKAEAGCDEMGANAYRKTLNGNVYDRAKRRDKLEEEFGDGETAVCVYCGRYIGDNVSDTLEQDKIITTRPGGKYKMANLLSACTDCNKEREDMPIEEALEMVVKFA